MSAYSRSVLQLTALCLILGASSFAADATSADASLYVVNGVPGRVVSADVNPSYPVDVLLNDEDCLIRGLTFTGSSGPFELPAGDYDIKISPANSLLACSNPAVAETTVKLSAGGAATVALALSNGTPTLLTFANNLTTVTAGQGRITIANASDAGKLEVTLTSEPIGKGSTTKKFTIAPGSESTVELPAGAYSLQATASGSTTPLVNGIASAESQAAEFVYITGSATNNAITLISRLVRDVF